MSLTLYNVVIRKIPDHLSLYADPIMVFKNFNPLLWELQQLSQLILYGVVDAVLLSCLSLECGRVFLTGDLSASFIQTNIPRPG